MSVAGAGGLGERLGGGGRGLRGRRCGVLEVVERGVLLLVQRVGGLLGLPRHGALPVQEGLREGGRVRKSFLLISFSGPLLNR